MRKWFIISCIVLSGFLAVHFTNNHLDGNKLRKIYSRSIEEWPSPNVAPGISWSELGVLPDGPLMGKEDSLRELIELGKKLFFDSRLSGSLQISCASCHIPSLSWADGKEKSVGHEGQTNKRNSPSLHNVWFYKKLFWDGRSHSLEDQAFSPINSESEMHGDMRELPRNLRKIKGYPELFDKAFGDPTIDPDRIASALATFQRTIISGRSKFDKFLKGDSHALSNQELRGMHLFRTRAGCMNCHNGPLFTDNSFHNNGFANNDAGLYNVTHKYADLGKMKTPSLRDVMNTGPWMHDGKAQNLEQVIAIYNEAKPVENRDPLIRELNLTKSERLDLLAFLKAISAPPLQFTKPVLPE